MISREALAKRRRLGIRQLNLWNYELEDRTDKNVGRFGGTHKHCSCWMCGNPRRRLGNSKAGKTIHEAKLFPVQGELTLFMD